MYLAGTGADIMGPGTSLVQRIEWTPPQERQLEGLGCACGGGCGCRAGLGLFDSMDPTTWGWQEWLTVGVGGYMLTSIFFTGKRAARQVGEGVRHARRRVGKRVGSAISGS